MTDRGGVPTAVLTVGLLVVGIALTWTAAAAVLAVGIGRVIARADREEGVTVDTALLGVVPAPRTPEGVPAA